MKFSVITVTFNAKEKLKETVTDILKQTYDDYEIIIKDGLSSDDSLQMLPQSDKIKLVSEKDKGIYDAMNRAVELASGDYICFMNCGDYFADEDVLKNMAEFIERTPGRGIYYGDTFWEQSQTIQYSAKEITDRVLYCNVPCHQSCFFARSLYDNDRFDLTYRIRADYDFFLRQCYQNELKPAYTGFVVAKYEGGGFSENKKNQKCNKEEHQAIVKKYMPASVIRKNKMYLFFTLAPLRSYISEKSIFSKLYQSIKKKLR
ncbi:MAG: glycosyltransferase family 2 protein [Lachnospiraceae bacterium]|nr:glycosyltransferase family 2 protein [Lachnospiraceae bacterium]